MIALALDLFRFFWDSAIEFILAPVEFPSLDVIVHL